MNAKSTVVPFGKHKGRSVEELLAADPAYLHWLASQDWFRDKYVSLHQTIINCGAEPEETPEHNAMQVRFLDDAFCLRFLCCHNPDFMAHAKRTLAYELLSQQEQDRYWRMTEAEKNQAIVTTINFEFVRVFEEHGIDVMLRPEAYSDPKRKAYVQPNLAVELKPTVADDYPAVLRQMKRTGSQVLLVGTYSGTGATRDQFVQTFATAGIRVVFMPEVEALQPPALQQERPV